MSLEREISDLKKRIGKCESSMPKLPTRFEASMGGGGSGSAREWETADSYPELVSAASVDITTLARVLAGDQIDQIYKVAINADDELYWKCIDEKYEADTKAGLVNNAYVQKHAFGWVGAILYIRNALNNGWEALNEFE